jgi:uncharacterized protein YukE
MKTRNLISSNLLFCVFLTVPWVCWSQNETPPEAPAAVTAEGVAGETEAAVSVTAVALSAEYLTQLEGRLQNLEDKLDLLITMQPRGTEQSFSRLTNQLSSEFRSVNQRLERLQNMLNQLRTNIGR